MHGGDCSCADASRPGIPVRCLSLRVPRARERSRMIADFGYDADGIEATARGPGAWSQRAGRTLPGAPTRMDQRIVIDHGRLMPLRAERTSDAGASHHRVECDIDRQSLAPRHMRLDSPPDGREGSSSHVIALCTCGASTTPGARPHAGRHRGDLTTNDLQARSRGPSRANPLARFRDRAGCTGLRLAQSSSHQSGHGRARIHHPRTVGRWGEIVDGHEGTLARWIDVRHVRAPRYAPDAEGPCRYDARYGPHSA